MRSGDRTRCPPLAPATATASHLTSGMGKRYPDLKPSPPPPGGERATPAT